MQTFLETNVKLEEHGKSTYKMKLKEEYLVLYNKSKTHENPLYYI